MKSLRRILICVALAALSPLPLAAQQPRKVNITSDSAPGWLPSEAQERQLTDAVQRYLSAYDHGDFKTAYATMAPLNQQNIPFDQYAETGRQFNIRSGASVSHTLVKITWTKDPANAPFPGIYGAVDLSARYEHIDRDCDYVVLYQPAEGDDFRLMREESNVLDNTTAQSIEQTKSKAELDAIWAQLSANCPNYEPSTANN